MAGNPIPQPRVMPTLRMTDYVRSKQFYVEGLGFQVDWEHRFRPGFPVFAQVSRDGLAFGRSLAPSGGSPGASLDGDGKERTGEWGWLADLFIRTAAPELLRDSNVLGARTFRALSSIEGHCLTLTQFVEARAAAGGLVKEVLVSIACRDEAKAFIGQSFDCAVHRHRRCLAECTVR